mmetsp:Transcript_1943/g.3772  ORF Transcript_1943/g.3772 Transcript_1943/m.3772 type:complete len:202 (-) Transcript_1943:99-704(-)
MRALGLLLFLLAQLGDLVQQLILLLLCLVLKLLLLLVTLGLERSLLLREGGRCLPPLLAQLLLQGCELLLHRLALVRAGLLEFLELLLSPPLLLRRFAAGLGDVGYPQEAVVPGDDGDVFRPREDAGVRARARKVSLTCYGSVVSPVRSVKLDPYPSIALVEGNFADIPYIADGDEFTLRGVNPDLHADRKPFDLLDLLCG